MQTQLRGTISRSIEGHEPESDDVHRARCDIIFDEKGCFHVVQVESMRKNCASQGAIHNHLGELYKHDMTYWT